MKQPSDSFMRFVDKIVKDTSDAVGMVPMPPVVEFKPPQTPIIDFAKSELKFMTPPDTYLYYHSLTGYIKKPICCVCRKPVEDFSIGQDFERGCYVLQMLCHGRGYQEAFDHKVIDYGYVNLADTIKNLQAFGDDAAVLEQTSGVEARLQMQNYTGTFRAKLGLAPRPDGVLQAPVTEALEVKVGDPVSIGPYGRLRPADSGSPIFGYVVEVDSIGTAKVMPDRNAPFPGAGQTLSLAPEPPKPPKPVPRVVIGQERIIEL